MAKLNEFLEIAPATKELHIGGLLWNFKAITLKQTANVIREYPQLASIFGKEKPENFAHEIADKAPEAVSKLIAISAGFGGEKKAIDKIAELGVGDQLDLLLDVIDLSFPLGLTAFMDRLNKIIVPTQPQVVKEKVDITVPDDNIKEKAEKIFGLKVVQNFFTATMNNLRALRRGVGRHFRQRHIDDAAAIDEQASL